MSWFHGGAGGGGSNNNNNTGRSRIPQINSGAGSRDAVGGMGGMGGVFGASSAIGGSESAAGSTRGGAVDAKKRVGMSAEDENEALKKEIRRLELKLDSNETNLTKLKQQLADQKRDADSNQRKLITETERVTSLERQLKQTKDTMAQKELKMDNISLQLNNVKKELHDERIKFRKVETDFERLSQAHERVQQENARLQDERARADGKHGSDAKKAAGLSRAEPLVPDTAELRRLQQENERLKKELQEQKDLNQRHSPTPSSSRQEQETNKSSLRRSLSHSTLRTTDVTSADNSALLAQNRQLEGELEASKRKIANLESTAIKMENEKMALIKHSEKVAEEMASKLRDSAEQKRQAVKAVEEQNVSQKKEIEHLKKQHADEVRNLVSRMEVTQSDLTNRIAEVKRTKEELDRCKHAIDSLKEKNTEGEGRQHQLRQDLRDAGARYEHDMNAAQAKGRELADQNLKLQIIFEASQTREAALKATESIDPATLDRLQADKTQLEEVVGQLRDQLAVCETRFAGAQEEIGKLRNALTSAEESRAENSKVLERLESDLNEARASSQTLHETVAARDGVIMNLQLEMEEAAGRAERAEAMVEHIKAECAQKMNEAETMIHETLTGQGKADTFVQELQRKLSEQAEEHGRQVGQLEAEMAQLREAAENNASQLTDARAQLEEGDVELRNLRESAQSAGLEAEQAKADLAALQQRYEQLVANADHDVEHTQALHMQIQGLNDQLRSKEEALANLESELAMVAETERNQQTELVDALEEAQSRIEELEHSKEDAEAKLDVAIHSKEQLGVRVTELSLELEEARKSGDRQSEAMDALQKQLQEAEQTIDQLETQLKASAAVTEGFREEAENLQTGYVSQLKEVRSALQEATTRCEELECRQRNLVEDLEAAVQARNDAIAQREHLTEELASCEADMEVVNERNAELVGRLAALERTVEEKDEDVKGHTAQISSWEERLEECRQEIDGLVHLKETLSSNLEDVQRMLVTVSEEKVRSEERVSQLKSSLDAAKLQADQLRQELASQQSEASASNSKLREIVEGLRAQRDEVDDKRAAIESLLNEEKSRTATLTAEREEWDAEKSCLSAELTTVRERLAGVEGQLAGVLTECESLKTALEGAKEAASGQLEQHVTAQGDLQLALEARTAEWEDIGRRKQELEGEIAGLRQRLETMSGEFDRSVVEAQQANEGLNNLVSEHEKTLASLESARAEYADMKIRYNTLVEAKQEVDRDLHSTKSDLDSVEEDLSLSEERNESLREEKKELESRLKALELELGEARSALEARSMAVAEMQSEISSGNRDVSSLEDLKKDMENAHSEALKQMESEIARLSDALEAADEEKHDLQETVQTWERQIAELESQLAEADSRRKTAESSYAQAQHDCAILNSQVGKLKEEAEASDTQQRAVVSDLTDAKEAIAEELEASTKLAQHLEGKLVLLQKEMSEKEDEKRALEDQLHETRRESASRLASLLDESQLLAFEKEQKSQLQAQYEEAVESERRAQNDIVSLQNTLSDLRQRLELAQAEFEAHKRESEAALTEADSRIARLSGDVEVGSEERAKLQAELMDNKGAIQELERKVLSVEKNLMDSRNQIKALEQQLEQGQQALEGKTVRCQELETEVERTKSLLSKKTEELDDAAREIATMAAAMESISNDCDELREQVGQMGEEQEGLHRKVAEVELAISTKETALAEEQNAVGELEAVIESLNGEIDTLKADLNDEKDLTEGLQNSLDLKRSELERRVEELDGLSGELAEGKAKIIALEERLGLQKAEMSSIHTELEGRLSEKDRELNEQIKTKVELEVRMDTVKKELEELSANAKIWKRELSERGDECAGLRHELDDARTDAKTIADQLEGHTHEIASKSEELLAVQNEVEHLREQLGDANERVAHLQREAQERSLVAETREEDLRGLRMDMEALQARLETLQNQKDAHADREIELQSQISGLEAEKVELKRVAEEEMRDEKARYAMAEERHREAVNQLTQMEKEVEDCRVVIDDLTNKAQRAEVDAAELRSNLDIAMRRKTETEGTAAGLEHGMQKLKDELSEKMEQNRSSEGELANTRLEVLSVREERDAMKKELQKMVLLNDRFLSDLQTAKERAMDVEKGRDDVARDLEGALHTIEQLQKDQLSHTREIDALQAKITDLEAILAKKDATLRNNEVQLMKRVIELETAKDAIQRVESELRQAQKDLCFRQEECSKFEGKCRGLEEELDGSRQEISKLRDEVKVLEQGKEDNRKLLKEAERRLQKVDLKRGEALESLAGAEKVGQERGALIKEKDEEIKALRSEVEKGRSDMEAVNGKVVVLENQLSELSRSREDLERQLDSVHRSEITLTREAEEARAKALQVANLRNETLEEVDALRKQLQSAEETISGSHQRIAELSAELTEQRAVSSDPEGEHHQEKLLEQVKALSDELEALKNSSSAKEGKLWELEATIGARDDSLQHAQEQYSAVVASAEQLRASLAEKGALMAQLQVQLGAAQQGYERMVAEGEESAAQLTKLSDELEKANNKLRGSEETLKYEQEQCALAVEECRTRTKAATSAEEKFRALQQEYNAKVSEKESLLAEKTRQIEKQSGDIEELQNRLVQMDQAVEVKAKRVHVLESDVLTLNHTIGDLNKSVDLLNEELAAHKTRFEALRDSFDEKLNSAVREKETQITELETHLLQTKEDVKIVEKRWEEQILKTSDVEEQLELAEMELAKRESREPGQLDDLRGEVERYAKELEESHSKLGSAITLVESLQAEVAILKTEREQLQCEIDVLRSDGVRAEGEAIATELIDGMDAARFSELLTLRCGLEQTRNSLKSAQEETAALRNDNMALKQSIAGLEERVREKQGLLAARTAELAMMVDTNAGVPDAESLPMRVMQETGELLGMYESQLSVEKVKVGRLEAERANMAEQIQRIQATFVSSELYDQAVKEIEDFCSADAQRYATELQSSPNTEDNDKIVALQGSIDDLNSVIESNRKEKETLLITIDEIKAQICLLEGHLEEEKTLKANIGKGVQTAAAAVATRCADLEERVVLLEKERDEFEKKAAKAGSDLSDMRKEIDALRTGKHDAEAGLLEAKQLVTTYEEQLKKSSNQLSELEESIRSAKAAELEGVAEKEAKDAALLECQTRLSETRKLLEVRDSEISAMNSRLNELGTALTSLQSQVDKSREAEKDLDKALQEAQSALKAEQRLLKDKDAKILMAEQEKEERAKALEKAEVQLMELKVASDELGQRIQQLEKEKMDMVSQSQNSQSGAESISLDQYRDMEATANENMQLNEELNDKYSAALRQNQKLERELEKAKAKVESLKVKVKLHSSGRVSNVSGQDSIMMPLAEELDSKPTMNAPASPAAKSGTKRPPLTGSPAQTAHKSRRLTVGGDALSFLRGDSAERESASGNLRRSDRRSSLAPRSLGSPGSNDVVRVRPGMRGNATMTQSDVIENVKDSNDASLKMDIAMASPQAKAPTAAPQVSKARPKQRRMTIRPGTLPKLDEGSESSDGGKAASQCNQQ
ncbi:hypothetical protein HK097_007603 [Rhizophlyctis rosea]|uniref:Uncharacterized protein n=1 Tax=Rhizophlyctis rosea TaxID=64517 RepID=A0AAD5X5N1_9FUNG|nr:hypothetical protein HK097_007603 [Rhizophlyctis rosea]